MYRILIFPGGTENGLEIKRSLELKPEIELISAADNVDDNASFYYEEFYMLPNVEHIDFLDKLNILLVEKKIDFIFPANSLVIDVLNKYRSLIRSTILFSNCEALRITRDKFLTYDLLKNFSFIPKYFNSNSVVKSDDLPMFVKPRSMYGSKGTYLVEKSDELNSIDLDKFVVTEFLPGEEVTIECFSDSSGNLLYVMPRTRERIRMGTSLFSRHEFNHDELDFFRNIATIISEKILIDGLWFFQMKKDSVGTYKLLEVECRVAGSMAFSRVLNVNLPYLQFLMFRKIGFEIAPLNMDFKQSRSLDLVYKVSHPIKIENVFVDLDDTLIIKNKVNWELIGVIYKAINNGLKIILITKSLEKDLNSYLKKFKISQLFDDIIHLTEDENKSSHMSKNSIFIENSFTQRSNAVTTKGLLAFSPDSIEIIKAVI